MPELISVNGKMVTRQELDDIKADIYEHLGNDIGEIDDVTAVELGFGKGEDDVEEGTEWQF
jgi:hypothetical protein